MAQTERAPAEVAKFFYQKYGREKALEIISSRLDSSQQSHDADFWQSVIQTIDSIEQNAGLLKPAKAQPVSGELGQVAKLSTFRN